VDWDNSGTHDLLIGDGEGYVHIYTNSSTNNDPVLYGGVDGSGELIYADGSPINVGMRATPISDDWDSDGDTDLLVGNYDGFIKIYKNDGSGNLSFDSNVKINGVDFDIGTRAAHRIYDFNGDGVKDILAGEVAGYVYYLENEGTNAAPVFNASEQLLLGDGTPLRYSSTSSATAPRSRFDVTDWNNNGHSDLVVGGADGRVMLFTMAPEPETSILFVIGGGVLVLSGFRKKLKRTVR